MNNYEDAWGTDEPEETEEVSITDNTLYNVNDFNDGIVDPTYINDIIDCYDLGIYPWGLSDS